MNFVIDRVMFERLRKSRGVKLLVALQCVCSDIVTLSTEGVLRFSDDVTKESVISTLFSIGERENAPYIRSTVIFVLQQIAPEKAKELAKGWIIDVFDDVKESSFLLHSIKLSLAEESEARGTPLDIEKNMEWASKYIYSSSPHRYRLARQGAETKFSI